MDRLIDIYRLLFAAYGPQHWWPATTPYEMMVGAILTQNTAWTNVEKALANLGERLNPEYILTAAPEDLAAAIRASGYHNQKAIRLKTLTAWYGSYGFDIETVRAKDGNVLREELLGLKGVGGETADSILLYALNKPYFVVDAYTRRILQRVGYAPPNTYEGIRKAIEDNLPKELQLYNEFHALIVKHAKEHCRSKPLCVGCPLVENCPYPSNQVDPGKPQ